MASKSRVHLTNRQKHPVIFSHGVRLGSCLDEDAKDGIRKPVQIVDGETWAHIKKITPAIQRLLDEHKLIERAL